MELSKLETDFLTDLIDDTYDVWELYQFVRLHHPGKADSETARIGYGLLEKWAERGWLNFYREKEVLSNKEALETISRMGVNAVDPEKNSIKLDVTEKVFKDVAWLTKSSTEFKT